MTPSFTPELIAKAYRMKIMEGLEYKVIARKLGVDHEKLRRSVHNSAQYGTLDRYKLGDTRRYAPILGKAELVLAYELHQNGCEWKHIAAGLGVSTSTIKQAVGRVMREGLPS
jgi:DNA-binding transcriptional regulator LsrR (DeoR family)